MPVEFERETELDEVFDDMLDYEGVIQYDVAHAIYVEFPTAYTSGKQPPFDPIHEWVERNWGELSQGLKDVAAQEDQSTEEHQEAVAWVVVKSIEESGTEGVFFAERALERGKAHAEEVVGKYAGSDDPEATRYIAEDMAEYMFEQSQQIIEQEATDTEALKESGSVEVYEIEGEDVDETDEFVGGGR